MLRTLANKLVVFHKNTAEVFHGTYDEFLDKIGWEEEASLKKPKKEKPSKNSKALKREAVNFEKQKRHDLKKLIKESGSLEKKILKLEAVITQKNDEAVRVSAETVRRG